MRPTNVRASITRQTLGVPSIKEHEIAAEKPFNAALSSFMKLTASVGWTEDLERGETLGEGEQGIVILARNSTMEGKLAVKTPQQNEIKMKSK
jgi:hypothetical protein